MSDILKEAAIRYRRMLDKKYNIVLGRKTKIYQIQLKFEMSGFFI